MSLTTIPLTVIEVKVPLCVNPFIVPHTNFDHDCIYHYLEGG